MTEALRLSIVPGITPGKWLRTWSERHPDIPVELVHTTQATQLDAVRAGSADMAFVRDPDEHDGLHLIPLYEELQVVVLPRDHPYAEAEELLSGDLGELQLPEVDALTAQQAVETVAAGTGAVVLPMSVARLHHRKDVVAVPVPELPRHAVGLAWPRGAEESDPRVEDFIGVVRGRTPRSSRGRVDPPARDTAQAKPKTKPRPVPTRKPRRRR